MARDYARAHELYLHLHELQPAHFHPYQYDLQAHSTGAPAYELTAGAGAADGAAGAKGAGSGALAAHAQLPQHAPQPQRAPHDPRKWPTTHDMQAGCSHAPDAARPLAEEPMPAQHHYVFLPEPSHQMHRRFHPYGSEAFEPASCDALSVSSASTAATGRKRKPSPYSASSAYDDDGTDDARSSRSATDKKQNHSEIEKRRRDKMNTYITELSAMVPMCGAMARKLDKLTVLRMAVQHMRSIRGALSAGPLTARPRPSIVSERELNALVLRAAEDCFLMVVGCDRGRLMFVSASVTRLLNYDQSELLGQSLFDILHPKDVAKVKEQLSSSDLSPRERLIDAKTMLPLKAELVVDASRLCPGARRSFLCRIKCRAAAEPAADAPPLKEEADAKPRKKHAERKYCVVQCTGYLKSWAPAELSAGADGAAEDEACNLSCLVAVGRALPSAAPAPRAHHTRPLQFTARHATDGKFLFVDQRVTLALGYLPQELLGTSLYEHVHARELGAVARAHKAALLRREPLRTPPYSFKKKDGTCARVQTHFKPFKNPWTKDVESLVANNTVMADEWAPPDADECANYDANTSAPRSEDFDSGLLETDVEMQRLIDSQVESHKIGATIAEEALRRASADLSPDLPPDLPPDLLPDNMFSQQPSLMDNLLGAEGYEPQVRNNVPLSAARARSPASPLRELRPAAASTPRASPPLPPLGPDGNGEAAMAVIMSLLEADAGLGGPVSFSGLPWPLP